jgi:UDPglucose--hexose-1-phosphate uridylyltransferase
MPAESSLPNNRFSTDPHRRLNALSGDWVLVSPHRAERPWQGQQEAPVVPAENPYDPKCYLCPGNARAGGHQNPNYTGTFVFENDFAALKPDTPDWTSDEQSLLVANGESGRARVLCFSPRHDLTLARMDLTAIERVVDTWCAEYQTLGADPSINSVIIFENRGEMMGSSNPHPHGQIWANRTVPLEAAKELTTQSSWFRSHNTTLLADYLALELAREERVVTRNDHFAVVVPFWALWPFETLLIARRPVPSFLELTAEERTALAAILSEITVRYDNLFQSPFPYTMGFHQQPTDGQPHPYFHLHAHFYPPLLRSATVKKFMVGYEMLGMPQRDITPEAAARRLRDLPARHYLQIS